MQDNLHLINAREPVIYQHRSPLTYQHRSSYWFYTKSFIRNYQTFLTIRSQQQYISYIQTRKEPNIRDAQTPVIARVLFITRPVIRDKQTPVNARRPANQRQPSIRNDKILY